jgi:hypothetical protein
MYAGFDFKIFSIGSLNGIVPSGQIQFIIDEVATSEVFSDGHATQVVTTVAATAVEYVPARQSVQETEPAVALYFPVTQEMHGPDPSGPVNPTLHVQAARAELAVGELELVGQARQVVATVAATAVEYVFPAQVLHAAVPVVVL